MDLGDDNDEQASTHWLLFRQYNKPLISRTENNISINKFSEINRKKPFFLLRFCFYSALRSAWIVQEQAYEKKLKRMNSKDMIRIIPIGNFFNVHTHTLSLGAFLAHKRKWLMRRWLLVNFTNITNTVESFDWMSSHSPMHIILYVAREKSRVPLEWQQNRSKSPRK